MGKRKKIKIVSIEVLQKKGTKELLGYLKSLQKCEESFDLSDMDENIDLIDLQNIYFKQTEKWRSAYNNVKSILKNREHINWFFQLHVRK